MQAYENVQRLLGDEPFSDEVHTSHSFQSESEPDDEEQRIIQDDEQFEHLR